ncbi:MAG TPA: Holliday junction resolvase RuvX [Ignavibacteria bacterium]|nr:Holliday junction resolvase RuvX [Ignavibacteria bacterium]HQY53220.1 Holliday junction resolvase RuvX [Ignavibacteria bacterium]
MNTKYMGIDYGEKRVGISVSDESKKFSFNRDYIFNDKDFYKNLTKLIITENVSNIVIGYPVKLNSDRTEQTDNVDKFAEDLRKYLESNNVKAELAFFDERLTSKIAAESLLRSGIKKMKRREKGLVDGISAQLILQDYLDKMNYSGR